MEHSPFRKLVARINGRKPNSEPSRHARRTFQRRASFSFVILLGTYLFLFLPLFVVVLYSFNPSKGSDFTGFSLVWYKSLLFSSSELWRALGNSVIVAVTSGAVATVLGTLAAIGVNWYKFKGKMYIQTVSFLPMILPEVIIGISMLIFFAAVKIPLGLFTIFTAHTTFCLPFVFLLVLARLDEFDYSIIEAAYDLGATERQTMFRVLLPAIMPGILSGFLIAMTMSLEDFVITFFVSGPGSATLPIYVYSMIRFGVSPVINALSFVMILATVLIAFALRKFLKNIAAAK
ncbi:MAG: ABC transporter permease [Spirochaetaceae bacterium]|jgi:spermidine/putrescine transport system permease protein|nr:ABC transporter permease [Spirochaetaceae bacterium]